MRGRFRFLWSHAVWEEELTEATLLANLSPILITVASFFLFHERVTWGFLVGLILAWKLLLSLTAFNLLHLCNALAGIEAMARGEAPASRRHGG